MADPAKTRLFGIEAVRAVAATAVIGYHVARHVDQAYDLPGLRRATQSGHAGVDLFFVISGFIILFVHYRDIGRPARLTHYLSRRFSRVMPIYWVALGLTVLMAAVAGHGTPTMARLLWSVTLLPSADEPVLGVAWTLQYEIMFYAAFGVLICSRIVGLALLAAWLCWIVATSQESLPSIGGIPSSLAGTYNLEFFLGMGIAYWLRRGRVPFPQLVLFAGLVSLATAAFAETTGRLDGYSSLARLAYGVPSALLILGLAEIERSGKLVVPGGMRALGAASYSLYLFQFVFIGATWQAWLALRADSWLPAWASFPVLAGAALLGGTIVSQRVEKPLLQLLRSVGSKVAVANPV